MEFQTITGSAELPKDDYDISHGVFKTLIRSLVQNKIAFKLSLNIAHTDYSLGSGSKEASEVKKLLYLGLPEDVKVTLFRTSTLSPSENILAVIRHTPQQEEKL